MPVNMFKASQIRGDIDQEPHDQTCNCRAGDGPETAESHRGEGDHREQEGPR